MEETETDRDTVLAALTSAETVDAREIVMVGVSVTSGLTDAIEVTVADNIGDGDVETDGDADDTAEMEETGVDDCRPLAEAPSVIEIDAVCVTASERVALDDVVTDIDAMLLTPFVNEGVAELAAEIEADSVGLCEANEAVSANEAVDMDEGEAELTAEGGALADTWELVSVIVAERLSVGRTLDDADVTELAVPFLAVLADETGDLLPDMLTRDETLVLRETLGERLEVTLTDELLEESAVRDTDAERNGERVKEELEELLGESEVLADVDTEPASVGVDDIVCAATVKEGVRLTEELDDAEREGDMLRLVDTLPDGLRVVVTD